MDNIFKFFTRKTTLSIKTTRVLRQHWTECFTVQCCPNRIKTTWTGFRLVQCWRDPQRHHYIEYLIVQCCPKSIKKTMNRIFFLCILGFFFCAFLSWASRTTLHRVYLCNVFPGVLRQHWKRFFLFNVVWNLLGNIAQGSCLCYVVPKMLKQQWSGFFSCAMLSGAFRTILLKVFTCSVLVHG